MEASRKISSDLTMPDAIDFALTKRLMDLNTMVVGEIQAVNGNFLTVKSLINYKGANNQPITPPKMFNVPYGAIQGGNAGIIIEPTEGDQVLIGFCQRDIGVVKSTRAQGTPGTNRFHAMEDAFVICCWTKEPPTIYVKITSDGVEITAPGKPVTINSQTATVTANQVDIVSSNINLGAGAVGVLNANTQFQVTGVQSGSDTKAVTIVPGTYQLK